MAKRSKTASTPSDPSSPTPLSLKPLTPTQDRHLKAIKSQTAVFATGPAGTGKTYVHAAWAAQALRDHKIESVILTRPVVEAGRGIGFLKGDANEKFAPYIAPFKDVFVKFLGHSFFDYCLKVERIKAIPLCLVQGCSWDNAVILATEMENSTPQEFKLLLTRVGEGSKILIDGDVEQSYIRETSGLEDALQRLREVPRASFIEYGVEEVVRSRFVYDVLRAYAGVSYR